MLTYFKRTPKLFSCTRDGAMISQIRIVKRGLLNNTARWEKKRRLQQPRPSNPNKPETVFTANKTQTLVFLSSTSWVLLVYFCQAANKHPSGANHLRQDRSPLLDKPSNFSRFWLSRHSTSASGIFLSPILQYRLSKRLLKDFLLRNTSSAVEQQWFYLPAGPGSASQCRVCDSHGSNIHNCLLQPVLS